MPSCLKMLHKAWSVPRYLNGAVTIPFIGGSRGEGIERNPWICRRVFTTHSGLVANTFTAPAVVEASTFCHSSGMGDPAGLSYVRGPEVREREVLRRLKKRIDKQKEALASALGGSDGCEYMPSRRSYRAEQAIPAHTHIRLSLIHI